MSNLEGKCIFIGQSLAIGLGLWSGTQFYPHIVGMMLVALALSLLISMCIRKW